MLARIALAAALALAAGIARVDAAADAKGEVPRFRVLAFYSTAVEPDHTGFARAALGFFSRLAERERFVFDATTDWKEMRADVVACYDVVMWVNDFPHDEAQRRAFEAYMDGGGGWIGFHVAGYNDAETRWPWLVAFLGGAVFYSNNWPPAPATLRVDEPRHALTKNLPPRFLSPTNEWYLWKPSPRANKDVRVLLTLDPSNYPLGTKDVLSEGDVPVVWTNTKYRMLYMNMGHIKDVLTDELQNRFIADALVWLGTGRR